MPKCKNCNKEIAEEVFTLHEVHCLRFLALCTQCGETVPKTKKAEHEEKFHKKEKCPHCSTAVDTAELGLHKTICPSRPRPCSYCGAIMDLSNLFEHEEQCGSRTEKCDVCNKNVVMKDMPVHLEICFALIDESSEEEIPKKRKPTQPINKKRGKK